MHRKPSTSIFFSVKDAAFTHSKFSHQIINTENMSKENVHVDKHFQMEGGFTSYCHVGGDCSGLLNAEFFPPSCWWSRVEQRKGWCGESS